MSGAAPEIVATAAEAVALDLPPLIVREPLDAFLDGVLPGDGAFAYERLGEGHSNITFVVSRSDHRWVLRRPPRPPLPPTAHDVLREHRVLSALADAPVRTPRPLIACDDDAVIGAPFYVMELSPGEVIRHAVPDALDMPAQRRRIGEELVDALAELHLLDYTEVGLGDLGKPTGYLERQVRRWTGQWEHNRTRELPVIEQVGAWLEANRPQTPRPAIVHGDYKLDNVLVTTAPPARVTAILDWEMATIGDPLADLGYLTGTWAEAGDAEGGLLGLSRMTRAEGFPTRVELVARYAERTGLAAGDAITWYEALALWKLAILLEGSYKRLLAGTTDDPFFKLLDAGVPQLAEQALAITRRG